MTKHYSILITMKKLLYQSDKTLTVPPEKPRSNNLLNNVTRTKHHRFGTTWLYTRW